MQVMIKKGYYYYDYLAEKLCLYGHKDQGYRDKSSLVHRFIGPRLKFILPHPLWPAEKVHEHVQRTESPVQSNGIRSAN